MMPTETAPSRRPPRRGRPNPAAAFLLLAAAVVTGCGSSTATSAPATATPTASPTPAPSATATPAPTVAPASLLPVPVSQFETPGPAGPALDDKMAAALQAALDKLRTGKGWPGASAAVMFPDGSLWTGVTGYAALSGKVAVTGDTLFSVASITKTFVAALVCRLVAAGSLGIDDPLSKYVPDFPNAANISLRQLLNHTSGVRDLFQNLGAQIGAKPARVWTPAEVLAGIGAPYFAPGTGYRYSNTDFVLLGLVIEKATGRTVGELIRAEFLQPLGLAHTFYQVTETPDGPLAHGYSGKAAAPLDRSAGQMIPFTAEVTAVGASGAYVSTAADLARWAVALYGGNILDQATLSSMADVSPSLPSKPKWPYGLGLEETTVAGLTAWGHRGHLDGFWSSMWYLPDAHMAVVVLTNADWADPVAAAATLVATTGAKATP